MTTLTGDAYAVQEYVHPDVLDDHPRLAHHVAWMVTQFPKPPGIVCLSIEPLYRVMFADGLAMVGAGLARICDDVDLDHPNGVALIACNREAARA